MTGFNHWVSESGHYERDYVGTDSDGKPIYHDRYVVDGYWHYYTPVIRYDNVGNYTTPEYNHLAKWTPLSGGIAGLLGGTVFGGITGFVVSLIHKAIKERK